VPFEIPESWVWTTIGDISLSILYGVSESAKSEGKYKLLRITDIQNNKVNWDTVPYSDFEDNVQNYILEEGDILFARTGATVGKSYLVNKISISSIYASYLIRVKSSKLVLPAYVKFFFESGFYWEQISMNAVGVGQPNVNGTSLANLRIPLPPYNEQIRIVKESTNWLKRNDILDNDIVELGNAIEHIKSKILDLAIHGKLVPQDPNDEPAIDLLRRINPDFKPCDNAHYKQLPKSWKVIHLGDICQLADGEVIPITELPYLDVKSLRNQTYTIKDSGKFIKAGTTLILVDGENSGEVFHATVDGYQGSTMKILNINSNINQQYVLNFIKLHQKALRENKVGSAIPHLNKKMFWELIIPIPPIAEQNRIVKEIDRYNVIIESIIAEL